jgi:probable HAF family extracellular repeat protein
MTQLFSCRALRPCCVILATLLAAPASGASIFTPLGFLRSGDRSVAHAVSGDGSTVVGIGRGDSSGSDLTEAFCWTADLGMTGLGFLYDSGGEKSSGASGVSADGSIIVGNNFQSGMGHEPFRWTVDTGMTSLGGLGFANAVSSDSSTVVGSYLADNTARAQPYRWTAEGGLTLLAEPGLQSDAYGVSADGSTVVGSTDTGVHEAFGWTAESGLTGLGDLPGGTFHSVARAISADGLTIVGDSVGASGDYEAFVWTVGGGMIGLGNLPGGGAFGSSAYSVSADGSRVVGLGSVRANQHAVIWEPHNGMRRLSDLLTGAGVDLAGWRLVTANGISPNGRYVVGFGSNPRGLGEAWLVDLASVIPEPPTASLLIGATAVLAMFRHGTARREEG